MKKLFIISAVLLGVLLIFLGVYNFAFKKKSSNDQQEKKYLVSTPTTSVIVPTKIDKIAVITDSKVIGLDVNKKTEEIKYYDESSGLVWKMDADGKGKKQITDAKVSGLKSVSWSPDNNKVLTTMNKDGQSSFYMYDHQLQKGILLKTGLDTAVWDNLGTKIFYKYYDATSKQRTLNVANPDGSDWQKIADIETRNLSISPVPLTSLVSYWNSSDAQEETNMYVVGVTGGEPKLLLNGKYGADYLWSPDGNSVLVSALASKDSKNVTLGLVTIDGKYQDLNIPTIVSKCVWSQDGKSVYYTLPGGIPSDAVMPNDYQENKFNTEDTFWKMNIVTGEKNRIIDVGDIKGKYDATNPILSGTEDALYFINKIDRKLYRIAL